MHRMLYIISEKYQSTSKTIAKALEVLHILSGWWNFTKYGFKYIQILVTTKRRHYLKLRTLFLFSAGCLYFLNSAINPFLYCLFSKQFRSQMYKGFLDKLGHLFRRHRSAEEIRDVPFHRRHNISFPRTLERYHAEEANNFSKPKIPAANCKGHVQSSKALRRHFGLPEISKTRSNEKTSQIASPNISQGVASMVHHAVEDAQNFENVESRKHTGILKKPKCQNCSTNNNKYSIKSEPKIAFKDLSTIQQTKTTCFSDTKLIDAKNGSNHIFMKREISGDMIPPQNV